MNPSLEHRNILVVGLAKSGVAAAHVALRLGAQVHCADQKPLERLSAEARALADRGAQLHLGSHDRHLFREADLIVVSPGVPLALPELQEAMRAGIEVVGEVEFAWRHLPGAPRFIGITGTNGKSTTTALAGFLCEQSGVRVFTGGNLGRPLSEAALEERPFDVVVCELSSFQLEGIVRLRPHAAILTNVTPDHIDRYESHEEYGLAKRRIFMNQTPDDAAIVNARDPMTLRLAEGTRGERLLFGFGGVDEAASVSEGMLDLRRFGERYRVTSPALRGEHNLENAMAAVLAVQFIGLPSEAIQAGLDAFPGLAHRLESLGQVDGVEYINDSKATNIDSTLVALKAFPRNVWLIAGGRGKGAPYTPMVEASRGRLKGVFTIGEDAHLIEGAYRADAPSGGGPILLDCKDLAGAVAEAHRRAVPGDVVLLSPACASYDQFNNFEERGEAFRGLIRQLVGRR